MPNALRQLVSDMVTEMGRRRIAPADLAARAGVPTVTAAAILSGQLNPPLAILVKLADALGRPAGRARRRGASGSPTPAAR
jgi:transcriptional regulator with XRE-family HTH domain